MRNTFSLAVILFLISTPAYTQIEMVELPVEIARYQTGSSSWLILNKHANGSYFISYRDLEIIGNYESITIGDKKTGVQFKDLIYSAFSKDDFVNEDAEDQSTKQFAFKIEDQLITVVRQYHKERQSVSIWLLINYDGIYNGSTLNGGKAVWESVLGYFNP